MHRCAAPGVPCSMNLDEQQTHFSSWAIVSAPLILGFDGARWGFSGLALATRSLADSKGGAVCSERRGAGSDRPAHHREPRSHRDKPAVDRGFRPPPRAERRDGAAAQLRLRRALPERRLAGLDQGAAAGVGRLARRRAADQLRQRHAHGNGAARRHLRPRPVRCGGLRGARRGRAPRPFSDGRALRVARAARLGALRRGLPARGAAGGMKRGRAGSQPPKAQLPSWAGTGKGRSPGTMPCSSRRSSRNLKALPVMDLPGTGTEASLHSERLPLFLCDRCMRSSAAWIADPEVARWGRSRRRQAALQQCWSSLQAKPDQCALSAEPPTGSRQLSGNWS